MRARAHTHPHVQRLGSVEGEGMRIPSRLHAGCAALGGLQLMSQNQDAWLTEPSGCPHFFAKPSETPPFGDLAAGVSTASTSVLLSG